MSHIVTNINGRPAIRVSGKIEAGTNKATLINFDGDAFWVPNDMWRKGTSGTIEIQEWKYKKLFPNG